MAGEKNGRAHRTEGGREEREGERERKRKRGRERGVTFSQFLVFF